MPLLDSVGQQGTYNSDPTNKPGGVIDTLLNVVDPAGIRMKVSGLFDGGVTSLFSKSTTPSTNIVNARDPTNPEKKDWRVKISMPQGSKLFYNDQSNELLHILARTGGVVFPYTPSITVTHTARYQEQALTHSNYKNYFYDGSDVGPITITGDFTVQNTDDGLYLLAAIQFFRSCTKMFFGQDSLAGNPPPVVYLDGYGEFYFPHVTCVVTSFAHTMPADCDYLEFKYIPFSKYEGDGSVSASATQSARLPTTSQLTVTVQPIFSRQNVHNNMSLDAFSKGTLLRNNGGFL
jgi:hypothetical protein